MAEKIKRQLIAHFLDISQAEDYSSAQWARLGVNVTSAATDYNPQTETEQDIVSASATTEITGYQPSMSVSQKCTAGDDVYAFVTELRRNRAVLGDAHTWMLNVDLWDGTGGAYAAEVQEVSIGVSSYGGDGGATPTQDFTINYVGDPVQGTVTMSDGTPSFTKSTSTSTTSLMDSGELDSGEG